MPKKIKIKINNKEIICEQGDNIYKVAKKNGIYIPGLCSHPDFPAKGNCRICLVEIKGFKNLATSCTIKAEDGLEIKTDTERVKKARNLNIELIFAEHIEKCATCIWRVKCPLLELADRYKIVISRFKDRKGNRKTYKFANAVELDGTQCIDCRNCIDACSKIQKINYLELKGKGISQEIVPVKDKNTDCIYCGQCAVHCPVGSAQEQADWDKVERILLDKKKIKVALFAPSIRVSIGEEFGFEPGKVMTEQIVPSLKALGFNYVFDVNFGADATTMVEAEELLKRVKNKKNLPMLTSCCPAWVKYVEFYHPELIPNLTTARSPQIHSGGIVKTYWAEMMKIRPQNIIIVSIMPCTAKKFESARKELKINGLFPVDYVLTVRELAWMIKKNRINFGKLKPAAVDNPFGKHSGAALIYGASGGVMESALRSARHLACRGKKICPVKIDFKEVRGLEGVKETTVSINNIKLRLAVVNCIGNIGPIIEKIKNYDYIEVMACPGGCIGGGGQPMPTTGEIRKKRMEALYKADKGFKMRGAHENENVLEVLKWLKKKPELEHKVLHTKYVNRK
jgi:NADH-quinone oxidoreductase subunit G/NADP-reducing hydrogenase subunit HndD